MQSNGFCKTRNDPPLSVEHFYLCHSNEKHAYYTTPK